MPATEPLQRVIDEADDLPPVEDSASQPQMPFETSYQLTREQEDELVEHALRRLDELENETGRSRTGAGEWWMHGAGGAETPDPQGVERTERTFMGKRILYDLVYRNDVEHRPHVLGGIFTESNLVVPLARRIVRQMTARAVNYFFSTDPWFAAYPVGDNDRDLASKADRYTKWKMSKADLQQKESMAVERAFVLGECVVKTTWDRREQFYKTFASAGMRRISSSSSRRWRLISRAASGISSCRISFARASALFRIAWRNQPSNSGHFASAVAAW
jgi:hypothetical protein